MRTRKWRSVLQVYKRAGEQCAYNTYTHDEKECECLIIFLFFFSYRWEKDTHQRDYSDQRCIVLILLLFSYFVYMRESFGTETFFSEYVSVLCVSFGSEELNLLYYFSTSRHPLKSVAFEFFAHTHTLSYYISTCQLCFIVFYANTHTESVIYLVFYVICYLFEF